MARYLIERILPEGTSEEEVEDVVRRLIALNATIPEIHWLHSYLTVDRSKLFCEYEAPGAGVLYDAARLADVPVDRVTEVIEVRAETYSLFTRKEGV